MAYYVYIATNGRNTVLYTGVTNDLVRRMEEHKLGIGSKFASTNRVNRLVYYEVADEILSAIEREKQIKGGNRKRKMAMIDSFNATWRDLSSSSLCRCESFPEGRSRPPATPYVSLNARKLTSTWRYAPVCRPDRPVPQSDEV